MLLVISPAKKLDLSEDTRYTQICTQPEMLGEAQFLVRTLSKMSPRRLGKLMGISDQLAELNHARYQAFSPPFSRENAKQAILSFHGDVYQSMEVGEYGEEEFQYAQRHLRILSGLYGMLRPLDLIQPYRLEMGTRLPTIKGKDLYEFWGESIAQAIQREIDQFDQPVLVNLASSEYFRSVQRVGLQATILTPSFKEERNGTLKTISLFAKQARGAMVDYAIKEKITEPMALRDFQGMGYAFQEALSTDTEWVFAR